VAFGGPWTLLSSTQSFASFDLSVMLSDDVLYVSLLLASIGWGYVTTHPCWGTGRGAKVVQLRRTLSTLFGLGIVILVSGAHTLHPIISILVQYLLIRAVSWKHVHVVSLVVGFSHLFLFRTCGYFQWLPPAPPAHTNAIQMILTLKMMGLAFEVHDSHKTAIKRKKDDPDKGDDVVLEDRYRSVTSPSLLNIFHYGFAHSGVLTGPYYRYRTFLDMYERDWSSRVDKKSACLRRIRTVPVYVILFLVFGKIFPIDAVKSDEFYASSIWWKMFYMTPVFFVFRMRLFSGFVLSECSCIMAGLGAYPSASTPKPGLGPSNLKALEEDEKSPSEWINFECVHNIDEHGVETVTTMREALKTWNMTVQWWLAANIYKRLPSSVPRALRAVAVMVTSSAWHGVYAGYYLSLGSVPFVLAVEDLYERLVRKRLVQHQKEELIRAYDNVAWFSRFQWFSYLGMGFQLLRVDYTLRFWHSIAYVGHLVLPIFYLIGLIAVKPIMNITMPRIPSE